MSEETCTECGCRPIWWWSRHLDHSYCRNCHEKRGYYNYPRVDPDILAAWLQEHGHADCEQLAADLLSRCEA